MKNVQVIDGADNCTYSVFEMSDEEFMLVFPGDQQDIEFIEDLVDRFGDSETGKLLEPVWNRPANKKRVRGIHGTLFYELHFKKQYYPTKREDEIVTAF